MVRAVREVIVPVKVPLQIYRMLVPVAEAHDVQVHQLGTAAFVKLAKLLGSPDDAGDLPKDGPRHAPAGYKPRPATLALGDRVRELAHNGATIPMIAETLQVSQQTVRDLMDYLGIPRPRQGHRGSYGKYTPKASTLAHADRVRELAAKGLGPRAIAAEMDGLLGWWSVSALMDYLGIERNHKPGRPKAVRVDEEAVA